MHLASTKMEMLANSSPLQCRMYMTKGVMERQQDNNKQAAVGQFLARLYYSQSPSLSPSLHQAKLK